MHFNIAQKIFGIAFAVLLLMVAVAVHSIYLTAEISDDLRAIAARDLPTSQAVAQVNVLVLDQGIVLQRLLAEENGTDDLRSVAPAKRRLQTLSVKVGQAFAKARTALERGGEVAILEQLNAIEREYKAFEHNVKELVSAREMHHRGTYDDLLAVLNARQDAIDQNITALHNIMAALTEEAVQNTDQGEQTLLWVNSALTVLATVLATVFAGIVTAILVRAVRNLVSGAKAVEAGELDTEVAVTSRDEIGALTESFNGMVGGLRLKERIKETFGKYMDPRIVMNLIDHPEFTHPGGERRDMTVMFIDLKGFTSISEVLEADDLVVMVNAFFAHMTDAIANHQGVVDKFMGDAVMAYWGPPFCAAEDQARLACEAALDAVKRLENFRAEVRAKLGAKSDGLDIDLRIGISSGEMIVGTIGSKVTRNFTVMGDPVNLGSRLEGANKAYGTHILVSEGTYERAKDDLTFREIDMIRVKGKSKPVRVYELLSGPGVAPDLRKGLAAYRAQDWNEAEKAFSSLSDDQTSQIYLKRIAHLHTMPPPENWDGVWTFESK